MHVLMRNIMESDIPGKSMRINKGVSDDDSGKRMELEALLIPHIPHALLSAL